MTDYISKRAVANGVNLHYIVAGEGPVVLSMHGWPQNHREFLPLIRKLAGPGQVLDRPASRWAAHRISASQCRHRPVTWRVSVHRPTRSVRSGRPSPIRRQWWPGLGAGRDGADV
jgi:hypothetical protein